MWVFKYEAPLGCRIDRGWFGVTVQGLWHNHTMNIWQGGLDKECAHGTHGTRPKSVKAFKRYLRKHPELKGFNVVFCSRYYNQDIEAVWEGE